MLLTLLTLKVKFFIFYRQPLPEEERMPKSENQVPLLILNNSSHKIDIKIELRRKALEPLGGKELSKVENGKLVEQQI